MTRTYLRTVLCGALFFSASLAAQNRPETLGTFSGTVRNDATGQPIRSANVLFEAVPRGAVYSTATGEAGAFATSGIEPGQYDIRVIRTGFESTSYGVKPSQPNGTALTLAPAQKIANLDFRLKPLGVISGRVLDANLEPVANAVVAVVRPRYVSGTKQWLPAGTAATNDLGEYRLYSVPTGRCLIQVTPRPSAAAMSGENRSPKPPTEAYIPTFYPGVTDLASAVPLDIVPGAERPGTDIRLPKVHITRIRGRIVNQTGVIGRPISLSIAPAGLGVQILSTSPPTVGPEGQFEIRNVAPGRYTLRAQISPVPALTHAAVQTIEVGNDPLDNLTITITAGKDIPGSVKVEIGDSAKLGSLNIGLLPRGLYTVGMYSSGRVNDDGTFTVKSVNPGRLYLDVSGIPDGYYVKSALMDREDVRDSGVDVANGVPGPLEIVLSAKSGKLQGSVTDDKGLPVEGAVVALVPEGAKRREIAYWYKTGNADQYGRFNLTGLTPGDYKLFSWAQIENGAWRDPDVLKPVESEATAVTIREGSSQTVDVKVLLQGQK